MTYMVGSIRITTFKAFKRVNEEKLDNSSRLTVMAVRTLLSYDCLPWRKRSRTLKILGDGLGENR